MSDSQSPIDVVIEKLANHGLIRVGDLGRQWQCRCPAHEDSTPSLSVAKGDGGKVLFKCFAGCETKDICAAIGLKLRDLFPAGEDDRKKSQPDGLSVCRLAFEKRLSHEWLRETCHVRDGE